MGKISRSLVLILALFVTTGVAGAQRVAGNPFDASVLPRGMARISIAPSWERFHERFADGLGRTAKGEVEGLAADFDVDSISPALLPSLAPVRSALQSILGSGTPPAVSAGRLQTRFDASVAYTPLVAEFGLTSRITVGVMVPLVKTRTEVSMNPNPGGVGATVGVNPSLTNAQARGANAAVVAQLNAAVTRLQERLQECMGSNDPTCSAINADRAGAQQLVTSAGSAATGVANVYGTAADQPGALFAPIHGSQLQADVLARLTQLSSAFSGFLGAAAGGGEWITAEPIGAPPMGYADVQRLMTDSAGRILADTLQSVELNTIGDVEAGIKVLLFDSFGRTEVQPGDSPGMRVRLAIAGLYRFGTGLMESANNFVDVPSADAQNDIEGRVFADVIMGQRFWASITGRYGVQQADEQLFRVPDAPHQPFVPASRLLTLERDLGDYMAAEFTPRLLLTRNITLGATYSYFSKSEDTYQLSARSVVDPDSAQAINPSVLGLGTASSYQRVLGVITYSNLREHQLGRARLPMEVSLSFGRTIAGENNAPKSSITALSFRFYRQIFGR